MPAGCLTGQARSVRAPGRFRRRRLGFVYQDYNLFPEYTAYENVVFPIHLDGRTEDPAHIAALLRLCCDEMKQTIVMVTHDAGMAAYADRIIRIRDGRPEEAAEGSV